jgi:hypothetical protein
MGMVEERLPFIVISIMKIYYRGIIISLVGRRKNGSDNLSSRSTRIFKNRKVRMS